MHSCSSITVCVCVCVCACVWCIVNFEEMYSVGIFSAIPGMFRRFKDWLEAVVWLVSHYGLRFGLGVRNNMILNGREL